MTGPMGFMADVLAISSGVLDLTVDASSDDIEVRPDIYVSPESGSTDTLDTIDVGGIQFVGMRLLLRGVTGNVITITHGTATSGDLIGINCPNDANYTLTGDNSIELGFDVVANKFAIIGDDGSGSAGGATFCPIISCENDLGTINGAQNIDWSLANFHRCIADGDIVFTMINLSAAGKYEPLILEIKMDGTGDHAVTFGDSFLNSHVPTINLVANKVTTLVFYTYNDGSERLLGFNTAQLNSIIMALSDETSALQATSDSVPIITFRMPYAMTLTEVKSSLTNNGAGAPLTTLDIKESGTTILSTALSIDGNELTSKTAATAAVISDSELADDAEITVFLTDKNAGATGLKLSLIGHL